MDLETITCSREGGTRGFIDRFTIATAERWSSSHALRHKSQKFSTVRLRIVWLEMYFEVRLVSLGNVPRRGVDRLNTARVHQPEG